MKCGSKLRCKEISKEMAGVHEEYFKRSCLRNRYGPHEKTRSQPKQQKFGGFLCLHQVKRWLNRSLNYLFVKKSIFCTMEFHFESKRRKVTRKISWIAISDWLETGSPILPNFKMIQDALELASHDRTCLMIAHRLSTVQRADVIVVMEHGRIVQQGTHDQLLNDQNGLYYKLCQGQSFRSSWHLQVALLGLDLMD